MGIPSIIGRARGRRLRAGGRAAAAVVLCGSVLALGLPGLGVAQAAADADGTARAAGGHTRLKTEPLCGTPGPGEVTCFALRRTDVDESDQPAVSAADPEGYGPADLRSAYSLPAGGGAGLTVAVVVAYDAPTAEQDLAAYRAQYGLPACTSADGCFTKVDQRGSTDYPAPDAGWAGEAALDLDMASAAAPDAKLLLVEADEPSFENLGAAVDTAVALGADVVSNSYGSNYSFYPESTDETVLEAHYNHPGVAIVASSGDDDYGVAYPAASPHVTAVGGTTLKRDSATARGWSESVWSHDGYGPGSGCSLYLPKPAFQKDTGCDNRTVADVSAVADPATGVAVYDSYGSGGWNVFGGTSASAPFVAGLYASADGMSEDSEPVSYPYTAGASALNDVTGGSNGSCSPSYLCTAGAGYDGPTGLGTPNGLNAFRIGSHGRVSGTVTDRDTGKPLAGASVGVGADLRTSTDADGRYAITVPVGGYDVTVDAYGYATPKAGHVTVADGDDLTQDVGLAQAPSTTVTGTVTDGSGHGWPLYASVSVDGTPLNPVWTDPRTGRYRVKLPAGHTYRLTVTSGYSGYQAVTEKVSVGSKDSTADVALPVDAESATALGYQLNVSGDSEPFTATDAAPDGWSVVDADGTTGGWTFDDPGGRANGTGGDGAFAIVDSDHYGRGTSQDTQLISPAYDLSGRDSPQLTFDTEYVGYSGQTASVDVSTDGGTTWTSLWQRTLRSLFGPAHATVSLADQAGEPDVRLRFHFTGSWGNWWSVDNVFVGERDYDAVPGGLVTGITTDANTGKPVNGVEVTGGDGTVPEPAVSTATPDDPRLGDGFYWLFVPTGDRARTATRSLTASKFLYADRTATTRVTRDRVTDQPLALKAGVITATSTDVTASVRQGSTVRRKVTLRNTGKAPATVTVHEASDPTAVPPLGDSWQSVPDLPWAVMDNAVDTYQGKVYNGFGFEGDDSVDAALHVYDPAAGGGWTRLADAPQERRGTVHGFIGGKWYVAGGKTESGTAVTPVAVYNPATDTWTSGSDAPAAYSMSGSAVLDGRLYMVGGCAAGCGVTTVQAYDVASDSWLSLAPYPLPIAYLSCGGVGGKVICAGGQTPGTGVVDDAYAYDPATNTWSPVASMPVGLWGSAYSVANGMLLASGGSVGTTAVKDVTGRAWAYDPDRDAWKELPAAGTPVYRSGGAAGMYKVGGSAGNGSSYTVTTAEYLPGYGLTEDAGIGWLRESATKVTVRPHFSVTVEVVLDAGLPETRTPGSYRAALNLAHDTPYPVAPVTVTLKVTAAPRHGSAGRPRTG